MRTRGCLISKEIRSLCDCCRPRRICSPDLSGCRSGADCDRGARVPGLDGQPDFGGRGQRCGRRDREWRSRFTAYQPISRHSDRDARRLRARTRVIRRNGPTPASQHCHDLIAEGITSDVRMVHTDGTPDVIAEQFELQDPSLCFCSLLITRQAQYNNNSINAHYSTVPWCMLTS